MAGLTKNILYESLRRFRSSVEQLKESLLEAEVTLRNRPLGYLEYDIQFPALIPNMLVLGTDMSLPEKIVDGDSDFNSPNPLRIMKNINRCKDAS